MKKILGTAILTGMMMTSTAFAAANPFEDVPANHWAYDAVAQLAKDGVVEGYGDGTYVGDAAITRYEMAQMVARAMAKSDLKHADKAMVDKLAAEFADELNNLGVRVAKLEKKVDNVKWGGEIRYRFINRRPASHKSGHTNQVLLRFLPVMQINNNWVAKARLDYGAAGNMHTAANDKAITVDRIYVEGTYGSTKILLGRLQYKSFMDNGLFINERVSGAQVTFGKDVKATVTAGRYNHENYGGSGVYANKIAGSTATYAGLEVYNNRKNKFTWGVAAHYLKNKDFKALADTNNAFIWGAALGYRFNKDFAINGGYLHNSKGTVATNAQKTAWEVELNYKGAKKDKPGSYGLFAAYRQYGNAAKLYNDKDATGAIIDGQKGIELGGQVTVFKNIQAMLRWFTGKDIETGKRASALFIQGDFWF